MNYQTIYNAIIERARLRTIDGYVERHHVIPRCLGGADDIANIVRLTAREHYVVHQLLVKMHPGDRKLAHAAQLMTTANRFQGRSKNRLYEWLRVRLSKSRKGVSRLSAEHKEKLRLANLGKKHSQLTKDKIRLTTKGRPGKIPSSETRRRMSQKRKLHPGSFGMLGKKQTPETRRKIGESRKGKPGVIHSEETKQILSQKNTGYKHTPEALQKMRESSNKRIGVKMNPESVNRRWETRRNNMKKKNGEDNG